MPPHPPPFQKRQDPLVVVGTGIYPEGRGETKLTLQIPPSSFSFRRHEIAPGKASFTTYKKRSLSLSPPFVSSFGARRTLIILGGGGGGLLVGAARDLVTRVLCESFLWCTFALLCNYTRFISLCLISAFNLPNLVEEKKKECCHFMASFRFCSSMQGTYIHKRENKCL